MSNQRFSKEYVLEQLKNERIKNQRSKSIQDLDQNIINAHNSVIEELRGDRSSDLFFKSYLLHTIGADKTISGYESLSHSSKVLPRDAYDFLINYEDRLRAKCDAINVDEISFDIDESGGELEMKQDGDRVIMDLPSHAQEKLPYYEGSEVLGIIEDTKNINQQPKTSFSAQEKRAIYILGILSESPNKKLNDFFVASDHLSGEKERLLDIARQSGDKLIETYLGRIFQVREHFLPNERFVESNLLLRHILMRDPQNLAHEIESIEKDTQVSPIARDVLYENFVKESFAGDSAKTILEEVLEADNYKVAKVLGDKFCSMPGESKGPNNDNIAIMNLVKHSVEADKREVFKGFMDSIATIRSQDAIELMLFDGEENLLEYAFSLGSTKVATEISKILRTSQNQGFKDKFLQPEEVNKRILLRSIYQKNNSELLCEVMQNFDNDPDLLTNLEVEKAGGAFSRLLSDYQATGDQFDKKTLFKEAIKAERSVLIGNLTSETGWYKEHKYGAGEEHKPINFKVIAENLAFPAFCEVISEENDVEKLTNILTAFKYNTELMLNSDSTVTHEVIKAGNLKALNAIIDLAKSSNGVCYEATFRQPEIGSKPLQLAISEGKSEMLKTILESGFYEKEELLGLFEKAVLQNDSNLKAIINSDKVDSLFLARLVEEISDENAMSKIEAINSEIANKLANNLPLDSAEEKLLSSIDLINENHKNGKYRSPDNSPQIESFSSALSAVRGNNR